MKKSSIVRKLLSNANKAGDVGCESIKRLLLSHAKSQAEATNFPFARGDRDR